MAPGLAQLRAFVCPLSHEVMVDPVVAADGHSYERESITRWLQVHGSSPVTKCIMPSRALLPNHALQLAIHELRSFLAPPREQLPQHGYFVYRTLTSMQACSAPSHRMRAILPLGGPLFFGAGCLVVVNQRLYGADTPDVFLRIDGVPGSRDIFLFESEQGTQTAMRVDHNPTVRVFAVLQATCITQRPNAQPIAPYDQVLIPGQVVSTDLLVEDGAGCSFARLEGTLNWICTKQLELQTPESSPLSFRLPYPATLYSNCLESLARVTGVVPAGSVVCPSIVVRLASTMCLVQMTHGSAAGWLHIRRGSASGHG
ncbi:hypothetical protein ACHHYP_05545 [Achlya hypogyna]|uniref:U-box domain-containing protein n=1 Tax=Achlya hypogyna TaxID=1202772 RepID=A0A1V9ZNL7_ACHHY|nr:hypothetical protein ACHHYP_05545 [Achlya hypogyna]